VAVVATWAVLIGYIVVIASSSIGAGYFAMFLCAAGKHRSCHLSRTVLTDDAGIYPYNAMLLTWVSNNLKPDYKRSVGIPLFASLANVSGLISSQIYPSSGGPRYVMGNAVSLAMEAVAMCGIIAIYLLLRHRNNEKQKLIAQGATDNGKEGDRALDFKYIL
jgi:hypothetical protein